MELRISNLSVYAEKEKILRGVNLVARAGEVHALMGQNGSGKSTLAKVLMGHPTYRITRGSMSLYGKRLNSLSPEERSHLGIFMAFQYPVEVPGVNLFLFLRSIYAHAHGTAKKSTQHAAGVKSRKHADGLSVSVEEFERIVDPILKKLNIKKSFLERNVNEDFSGGEKKKTEILQLALLNPKLIVLDETDSGLDVDALLAVAKGVLAFRAQQSIVLLITHYQRILKYIKPDKVHVMSKGRMVKSGDYRLAKKIEQKGYAAIA